MLTTNIRVRSATPDDCFALARIFIDATRSAFSGRVPDACLNWLQVEESATNWKRFMDENNDLEQLLVAEVSEVDTVALILVGRSSAEVVDDTEIASRYPIEVSSIQVDPAWQRLGLGRLLIQHAAQLVAERGADSLMVRVLRDNPNVSFYKALGAEKVGSQPYDWEGYKTSELIMGWNTIGNLTCS